MAKITIDTDKIVDFMIEYGIKVEDIKSGNFAGWSDAILEGLESVYNVEKEVRENC